GETVTASPACLGKNLSGELSRVGRRLKLSAIGSRGLPEGKRPRL
ncbi:hypothetical protein EVA_15528, partial [gut metagenome]